jgi:5-methylcytosine-specific restriction endonuclease McrA
VFERDGWVCRWCGVAVTPATADLDHVVELVNGGAGHDLDNLVTACRTCNRRRGGRLGALRRQRRYRLKPSRTWL